MDINCTLKCGHQKEGKCILNNISFLTDTKAEKDSESNCPYFTQRQNSK